MATIMKVRRQGGARVVTLPSALLERIGADLGSSLSLDVKDGAIVAKPVVEANTERRRRYGLDELLIGAEHLPDLYASVSGALDGDPVGNEIG